jgi:hypothetical protein
MDGVAEILGVALMVADTVADGVWLIVAEGVCAPAVADGVCETV